MSKLQDLKNGLSMIRIACPVDATFVTPGGEVIARFENHELVEFDENYGLAWTEKDSSTILIDESVDYEVILTGNDIGSMDIGAVTMDTEGEVLGTFVRENEPVYRGEQYALNAVNKDSADEMTFEALLQLVDQGELGNGFTWKLYNSGRLSIEGEGTMPDRPIERTPDTPEQEITAVEFGEGITFISAKPLAVCSSVTGVHLPASLKSVAESAFAGCTALETVVYDASSIARKSIIIFSGNDPLKNAVWDCNNRNILSELGQYDQLVLPDGMTEIGENAFRGIAAQVVVLPRDCERVMTGAFADCERLEYIISTEYVTYTEGAFGSGVEVIER